MKKTFKKMLSLLLAVMLIFSVCSVSFAVGEEETTDEVTGFTEKDFLTTKGTKIVNAEGKQVTLKGVNLGSWLIIEDWLSPYEEATDNLNIFDTLTERFGEEKAYELMNIYQDNWITEYDLDEIKSMGFNCVRVPFWFRNFYYDDNGRKILDEDGNWDFSRLDWVVSECKERELYVILDMHGAVGYQSDALHNGKQGGCGLFDKTEQGERYRELTDELWTAIADRFKGEPTVAMYDLLNEPMCDVKCTEVKRRINNESIYTRLYDTVRAADPDHIITMECIWTAAALPHSFVKGWKNVVYQLHFYNNNNAIFNFFVLMSRLYQFNVPLIMGEFYPLGTTTWNNCFKTMNTLNVNWMLWTYKAAGHGMWESDWALRGSKDGFERAKLQTDSYEEIARKWGECMRTENGYQDTGHYDKNVKDFL
ncbi:MAG: glycoside hydrolase family 5 protein [Acutalibacteraceae bacterium]